MYLIRDEKQKNKNKNEYISPRWQGGGGGGGGAKLQCWPILKSLQYCNILQTCGV